jgi:hypothetical protein
MYATTIKDKFQFVYIWISDVVAVEAMGSLGRYPQTRMYEGVRGPCLKLIGIPLSMHYTLKPASRNDPNAVRSP